MQDFTAEIPVPGSTKPAWRREAQAATLVGIAHLSSHFFQMLLPPLYPWLMQDFGIGYMEAGFLATVFFVISSAGQAVAGFAVDRFGAYRVLLMGLFLLMLSGVMLGLTTSYAGLMATAALAGTGSAMFHPADFTILNRKVSPARLGHAFAMHGLSGNLGWAAGATFMAAVTAVAGWHVAGFCAAALVLLVLLLLLTQSSVLEDAPGLSHGAAPPATAPASAPRPPLARPFAFLGSATIWMCFAYFLVSSGAGGILQNFAPAMLSHLYPVSLAVGTVCLTAYLLGAASGMIVGGFIAGRERRSALVVAISLTLAAIISLALVSGRVPAAVLVPVLFLLGCSAAASSVSRDMLVRQVATTCFGPDAFGRIYGFVYAGLDAGLALGPLLVGHVLDRGLFQTGLLCVAVLQLAAGVIAVRLGGRTRR